ncbi:hypothetical protein CN490_22605 [Bacillus cereus]|nr:hypothetical protein CN490_22605 [Bacillus cereus]
MKILILIGALFIFIFLIMLFPNIEGLKEWRNFLFKSILKKLMIPVCGLIGVIIAIQYFDAKPKETEVPSYSVEHDLATYSVEEQKKDQEWDNKAESIFKEQVENHCFQLAEEAISKVNVKKICFSNSEAHLTLNPEKKPKTDTVIKQDPKEKYRVRSKDNSDVTISTEMKYVPPHTNPYVFQRYINGWNALYTSDGQRIEVSYKSLFDNPRKKEIRIEVDTTNVFYRYIESEN